METVNLSYEELLKKVEKQEKEIQILKANQNGGRKNLFQTLFTDSYSIKLIIDFETGQIIDANKSACKFYGYSFDELTSMNINLINTLPPEDVKKEMQNAKSEVRNYFNFKHRLKNGQIKDVEVHSGKILIDNITYLYSIINDVSEKKQNEAELKIVKEQAEENELKYKNLFLFNQALIKYLPNPLFYKDKNGKYLGCNPAFEQFTGKKESEIVGKTVYELWKTDLAKTYHEKDIELINNDEIFQSYEFLVENANKEPRTVIFNKAVFHDEHNNPAGIVGAYLDITERKENEKEIIIAKEKAEESERKWKTLVQTIPDWIAIIDKDNKFAFMNHFAEGFDESNVIGVSVLDFILGSSKQIFADAINKTRKTKTVQTFEHFAYGANMSENYYHNFMVPIDLKEGKILIISRDITERKENEKEIILAKEKAEESDRLKSAFLQNLSHEIRTPLNAICGFSGRLNKPQLSEEKRESFVSIIQNSSNQLLSIISHVLTISALETNQEKVNIDNVCVNNIIVDLLAIFKQQSVNQNISLYAKQPLNDKQSEIFTDKTKITQILSNLISNAMKFTHEGFIEFGYNLKNDELEFYVKDSGIGIKQELQEKIFERFGQADLSINSKYGGTGLGLAISKGFAELLGGKIWVNSEIDKGSTFYFTIPYKPVNEPITKIDNNQETQKQTNNKLVILVAEDEEFNFLYIEELLIDFDYKLIHAKDGQETVDIFKTNPDISLILMDIKMPIMDGHTAAKIIKELKPNMQIIAQSAYALEHEIEKYSGIFDDYLTKPIKEDILIEKVTKCMNNK